MYKIRTLDDYVASASGVPVQRFTFSYRLNSVSDGEQYVGPNGINVCTWPVGSSAPYGVVGYPHEWGWYGSIVWAQGDDGTPPSEYQQYALSWSTYNVEGVDSLWDMSVVNATYESPSPGQDPLALLHSFTAFGAVGTVYLVDMLSVISLSHNDFVGSEIRLNEQDVYEIYARPAMRESTSVYVAYGDQGPNAWDQVLAGWPAYTQSAGFSPLDDPAAPLVQAALSSVYTTTSPEAPWSCAVPVVEHEDMRSWRAEGRIPALRSITTSPGVSDDGYLYIFDVIASVELTSTSVANSIGLSDGKVARIAPDSNLGILFNGATATASPTLLQGTVKLLA